jgi:hypothetical protein
MSEDRILWLPGLVDIEEIARTIEEVGVGAVRVESFGPPKELGVVCYFDLYFRELGSRKKKDNERQVRGHQALKGDSVGHFPRHPYTMLSTGAFGCTDQVLKTLGQRFGGFYEDEATGEEISFDAPYAPSP